jgi:hypothetical protein
MSSQATTQGRYRNLEYARWAKIGFAVGLLLLIGGATGEIVGHAFFESVPAWEKSLFFYSEVAGVLIGFFSVGVFGVFLPLTE